VHWIYFILATRSNAEIQDLFEGGRSIERSSELLYAPARVFQYYVQGFAMYLMSPRAKNDPDAASSFLGLLESREKRDPDSVARIYAKLSECVEFVATHQEHFDADQDIYGNFADRAAAIRRASS
jgi:hypothetical protein